MTTGTLANELRESCPHFYNKYSGGGYWVFTRHEAVKDIYKTPEIFSSESITPWEPNPIYRFVPTQVDAPDHIKYRRILNPWFSPKAMEAAAPMMRELCRSFIEPLVAKGRCDFIEDFALLYPTAAFLNVIGVPVSYTEQFAEWVDMFFGGFGGDPEGAENMGKALSEMRVFWSRAARRPAGQVRSRRGTSSPTCSTRPSTTSRWTRTSCSTCARCSRSRAWTRRAPSSGTCSTTWPSTPRIARS